MSTYISKCHQKPHPVITASYQAKEKSPSIITSIYLAPQNRALSKMSLRFVIKASSSPDVYKEILLRLKDHRISDESVGIINQDTRVSHSTAE